MSERELTERRKADRAIMAGRIAQLALNHRLGNLTTGEQHGSRQTSVDVTGPHTLGLTVQFQGRSPHPQVDTYVLSWHMRPWDAEGAGWRLAPDAFGRVNPHTGTKATDVVHGFASLEKLLARRFAAITDGSAFVSAQEDAQ